jgi:dTDP-4-dehydrorhamnose reductase/beta-phosphoglucomutase-like phosphatase (HAD superfamily)
MLVGMKILVAGGSGLLGRSLINLLEKAKIEYVPTYNSRVIKNGYKIDYNNLEELTRFFEIHRPSVCVNCIAQRFPDICEKNWNETKRINIDIADRLSKVCSIFGVYFIHISTDYVFDGNNQPNTTTSKVNPIQNYGISKLISELRVTANTRLLTIVRVPVLYCDQVENLEESPVTLIGKKILNQVDLTNEDNYSIRRPVYVPDFCKYLLSLIQSPKHGTFHFYNPNDRVTKYEIAKQIAEFLGKNHTHITPINTINNHSNRPYDTELYDSQYSIHDYSFTPLEECIHRCFYKWKHPNLMRSPEAARCFLLLDLDGTLLDTDVLHYEAYKSALVPYNINLEYNTFVNAINNTSIDDMLLNLGVTATELTNVKKSKYTNMISYGEQVKLIEGVNEFLQSCLTNGVNMAIVTNTSRGVVNFYKEVVPILNQIENWICREDYTKPKPDSECYKLAIERFYKKEEYIIGFENTLNGYYALKPVSHCIYFITDMTNTNYAKIAKEDIFLIRNFRHFTE